MEKVRILAFDPGTANMGFSLCEGNTRTGILRLTALRGVKKTSKKDGGVRARVDILSEWLLDVLSAAEPTHIVIEDYTEQGVKSGKNYKDMSILIENMRMTCRGAGFEADIMTNAEWKTLAVGTGGLNKKQIQHFVSHKVQGTESLGSRLSDTHIWDTVGIAYAKFRKLQGE